MKASHIIHLMYIIVLNTLNSLSKLIDFKDWLICEHTAVGFAAAKVKASNAGL